MTARKWINRFATLASALLVSVAVLGANGQTSTPRRIEITASRFSYSPSEITLKKGEPVVLVLTTSDVTHGLSIKDFGVKTEIKKGQPAELAFTPTKTGTFQGKCSHFCGKGHGSMILQVNVVE